MAEVEVFLQGEGIADIVLVQLPEAGTVRDIVEAAQAHGLHGDRGQVLVFSENAEEPFRHNISLHEAGIRQRSRVHVHRCHKVEISVNFNAGLESRSFPPSATMEQVKRWAVGAQGFNLSDVDATENVLQVCNTATRPYEDIQIGTLVQAGACTVCFDLVPKLRVEG